MLDKSKFLKALNEKTFGFWSTEPFSQEIPGFLSLGDSGQLSLEMHISKENIGNLAFVEQKFLRRAKKNFPVIVGRCPDFGIITLFRNHVAQSMEYLDREDNYKIKVMPAEGWIGDHPISENSKFSGFCATFENADIIARGLDVNEFRKYRAEDQDIFEKIGKENIHTAVVIANNHQNTYSFKFDGTDIEFSINGGIRRSYGNTNGICISTTNQFYFNFSSPKSIAATEEILRSFETLMCVASVGTVSSAEYDALIINGSTDDSGYQYFHRFYRLGEISKSHLKKRQAPSFIDEALIQFDSSKINISELIQRWFDRHTERYAARWLFREAVLRENVSVNRFLDIARAVEIVGDEGLTSPYPSKEFKIRRRKFSREFSVDLREINSCGQPTSEIVESVASALNTLNRRSFRDKILNFISSISDSILSDMHEDRFSFAKKVRDCRDFLTHMNSDTETLTKYEDMSFRLTYKLLLIYCLREATDLGVGSSKLMDVTHRSDLGCSARYNG